MAAWTYGRRSANFIGIEIGIKVAPQMAHCFYSIVQGQRSQFIIGNAFKILGSL